MRTDNDKDDVMQKAKAAIQDNQLDALKQALKTPLYFTETTVRVSAKSEYRNIPDSSTGDPTTSFEDVPIKGKEEYTTTERENGPPAITIDDIRELITKNEGTENQCTQHLEKIVEAEEKRRQYEKKHLAQINMAQSMIKKIRNVIDALQNWCVENQVGRVKSDDQKPHMIKEIVKKLAANMWVLFEQLVALPGKEIPPKVAEERAKKLIADACAALTSTTIGSDFSKSKKLKESLTETLKTIRDQFDPNAGFDMVDTPADTATAQSASTESTQPTKGVLPSILHQPDKKRADDDDDEELRTMQNLVKPPGSSGS